MVVAADHAADVAEHRHLVLGDLLGARELVEEALVERLQVLRRLLQQDVVNGQGGDRAGIAAFGRLAERGQGQDLVEVGVGAQLHVHQVSAPGGVVLLLLHVADPVLAVALDRADAEVGPQAPIDAAVVLQGGAAHVEAGQDHRPLAAHDLEADALHQLVDQRMVEIGAGHRVGGEMAGPLDQAPERLDVLGPHAMHQPLLPADLGRGPGGGVFDALVEDRVHGRV